MSFIGCSVKWCWTYCVATENQGHLLRPLGNGPVTLQLLLKSCSLENRYSGHKVVTVSGISQYFQKGMTVSHLVNGSIPIWVLSLKLCLQSMFQWQRWGISLTIRVGLMTAVLEPTCSFQFHLWVSCRWESVYMESGAGDVSIPNWNCDTSCQLGFGTSWW